MHRGRLSRWVVGQWRRPTLLGRLTLDPLAMLFGVASGLRRWAYRVGLKHSQSVGAPVIIVGNLTVGGSGKTPLVAHLVSYLAAHGYRPGVVMRGYGGSDAGTRRVSPDDDPARVGDEPLLLALRCGCPVARGTDRVAAARSLVCDCDVIVSDDGLQHYPLARDVEVAVIDGDGGVGNGRLLPAGPMREPSARLDRVDAVAVRDGELERGFHFSLRLADPKPLDGGAQTPATSLEQWRGHTVHAVAGIGVPERFFGQLEDAGLRVQRHPFPDHHPFAPDDLAFGDGLPVLMTEKDAVKCRRISDSRMWFVPAEIIDFDGLAAHVATRLTEE